MTRTTNKSVRAAPELWDKVAAKSKELGIKPNAGIIQAMEAWVAPSELAIGIQAEPVEPEKVEALAKYLRGDEANCPVEAQSDAPAPAKRPRRSSVAAGLYQASMADSNHAATVEKATQVVVGSLLSTPAGAKLSDPKPASRWDWAKPEKRGKK